MSDLRKAAQQALEALEAGPDVDPIFAGETEAALRAALAQEQPEPAQEPVAWGGHDLDAMVEAFSRVIEAHYQRANPFQNPIDMDAQMALRALRGFIPAMKAYTAPLQRPPLTVQDLQQALVDTGLIFPEAIDDAEGFDHGVTLERIDKLHLLLVVVAS